MTGEVEFVGYFCSLAGCKTLLLELSDDEESVYLFLKQVETTLSGRRFRVLNGEKIIAGVLIFWRKDTGGLERVNDISVPMKFIGNKIVIAGLMGGG